MGGPTPSGFGIFCAPNCTRGDIAVSAAGAVLGSRPPVSSADKLLTQARAARDELVESLAPLKRGAPAAVTAGYNRVTGQVAARASCGGGICAEDKVVEALGGNKTNVVFTEAKRPRTGKEVRICLKCEANYGREAFPPGTGFRSDYLRDRGQ
jgi:hypothetical protein